MATRDPSKDPSFDLGAALVGIEPPALAVDVTAGFFHRTLARWLGLPEGKQPGRKKSDPPLWDYDFWKAELEREAARDDVSGAAPREEGARGVRTEWTARVFRTADGAPEVYRYWVKLDAAGRIKNSGWIGNAPDLLREDVDDGAVPELTSPRALTVTEVERVFADDDG